MFAPDEMERGPCRLCGAHNVEEAETVCRPINTPAGSDSCGHPEDDVDAEGYFLHPTAAAIARLDAWCDEQAREMGQVVRPRGPKPGSEA